MSGRARRHHDAVMQLHQKIERAEPNDPRLQGWAEQLRQVLKHRSMALQIPDRS